MHSALLIDEILRQIFLCAETDRKSLLACACTCKAWKDPALDYIWERLSSFGPLLLLLPGVSFQNGEYVFGNRPPYDPLLRFKSYAGRVKHVNHRQAIRIQPAMTALSPFTYSWKPALPNIRTAHITLSPSTSMLIPMGLSLSLEHLDVDLGFRGSSAAAVDVSLCNYLEQVTSCCPNLRRLSLRGLASTRLNAAIAGLSRLQALSLRLGRSLLPDTLTAITQFPHLSELEIHAGHIDHNELNDVDNTHATFNSLNKLTIRAKTLLVDKFLGYLQPDTLHSLKIDLDDADAHSTSWNSILSNISDKAENTLTHLTLEHQFEITEAASPPPTSTSHPVASPSPQASFSIDFDALQLLRNTRGLLHLSCDLTLPPLITDNNIEKLTTWWPNLECLIFGSSCIAQDAAEQTQIPSQISPASLTFCATKMKKLRRLGLPLTINDASTFTDENLDAEGDISNIVHTLSICLMDVSNPQEIAKHLQKLFPGIHTLESLHESEAYVAVNNAIREA